MQEDFVNDIAFAGSQINVLIDYIGKCKAHIDIFPNLQYRCDYILKTIEKNPWENSFLAKMFTMPLDDDVEISSNGIVYL